jgi:hypothetical protein
MAINYASLYCKLYAANAPLGDAGGTGGTAQVLIDHRYSSGVAANQADKVYHQTRPLGAAASEDLDLTTLTDSTGIALALAEVTCLVIEVSSAAAVDVSPGVADGFDSIWTGVEHCKAGSTSFFFDPSDPAWIVDGTHKVLTFLNLSGAVDAAYTLTILGRSA